MLFCKLKFSTKPVSCLRTELLIRMILQVVVIVDINVFNDLVDTVYNTLTNCEVAAARLGQAFHAIQCYINCTVLHCCTSLHECCHHTQILVRIEHVIVISVVTNISGDQSLGLRHGGIQLAQMIEHFPALT